MIVVPVSRDYGDHLVRINSYETEVSERCRFPGIPVNARVNEHPIVAPEMYGEALSEARAENRDLDFVIRWRRL